MLYATATSCLDMNHSAPERLCYAYHRRPPFLNCPKDGTGEIFYFEAKFRCFGRSPRLLNCVSVSA